MGKESVVIASLEDLVNLPDDQLRPCLAALATHIRRIRRRRASATAQGLGQADALAPAAPFVWTRVPRKTDLVPVVAGDTPLEQLKLRRRALFRLREMNIYCLEDLAEATEREVAVIRDLGPTTRARLRGWLQAIGLDFKPEENWLRREEATARALRELPPEARANALQGLDDAAPAASLGLRPTTLRRARKRELHTVGQLRERTLRALTLDFGPSELREVYRALEATGRGLATPATTVELWRAGLLEREAIAWPCASETHVAELEPWLGHGTVATLSRSGINSLRDLYATLDQGSLSSYAGIGAHTARRIVDVVSAQRRPSRPPASGNPLFPAPHS